MSKFSLRNVVRMCLIVVIFLSELASSIDFAQAKQETTFISGFKMGKMEQKNRSVPMVEQSGTPVAETVENRPTASTELSASTVFVENIGQFDQRVRFQSHFGSATVHFMADSVWLTLLETVETDLPSDSSPFLSTRPQGIPEMKTRKGVHIKIDVMGSNPHPEIEPFGKIATNYSYFIGASSNDFRTDIPVWQGIRYVDIYPGMDLEIKGAGDHAVWEFIITDAALFYEKNQNVVNQGIRLHLAGQKKLNLKDDSLDVTTEIGSLLFPEIFLDGVMVLPQLDNNKVVIPVPAQLSSLLNFGVNFHTVAYDLKGSPLSDANSVKPAESANTLALLAPADALVYSTYIGGSTPLFQYDPVARDIGSGMAVAGDDVYFTGVTQSADFLQNAVPQNTGVFDSLSNVARPFIAKLNIETNQFEYVSYFYLDAYCFAGGYYHILTGRFFSIQVDASGNVYAGGANPRPDFPMINALDTQLTGTCSRTVDAQGNVYWYHPIDGFLIKLNSTGTQLLYSSYLGGLYEDKVTNIAVDPSGGVYAVGYTYSNDIPSIVGGYDPTQNGGLDVFITKIYANSGAQSYFSYLGGTSTDNPYGIALGQDGSLYVTGRTFSSNFPTLPASTGNTCPSCYSDGFVAKMNPTGGLAYSRFLGGTIGDIGSSIAVDQNNHAFVSGFTNSTDFPEATTKTDIDIFFVELDTDSDILYSTRFGGGSSDFGYAITLDDTGKIYIVGETVSMNFPWTPNAFDQTGDPNQDLFITKLDPQNNYSFDYSTYLGGSSTETIAPYVIVNDQEELYLQVTQTISSDFPTRNAFDSTYNGGIDMMIVKLATDIPLIDCSGVTLSPIAQAVKNSTLEQEYHCGNYYDSDSSDGEIGLISLPPGQAAFERFGALAETAEYEVDFVTMGWDPDRDRNITDSPGDYLIDGIEALYDRVKANPGSHSVRVRILLGLKYYWATNCQDQRLIVMNDLDDRDIELTAPNWSVEVAAYRESNQDSQDCTGGSDQLSGIHSHAKMMVVDGEHAIAAGYNMHYNYLGDLITNIPPVHDMGIQISGPVAYRSLQTFDELWALAYRCDDIACTQESRTQSFGAIPHDLQVSIPDIAGNDVAFSLFRDHVYKTADNAIAAAIEAASSEVNIIQNRFQNEFFYTPPQYVTAILNALDNNVQVNLIVSGGPLEGVLDRIANTNGVCTLYKQIFALNPLYIPHFDVRSSTWGNPIHTKALSIDETFVIVGGQNFDASAWGSGTGGLAFGDLAEYSLGIEGIQADDDFDEKFWAEWNDASLTVEVFCLANLVQDTIDQATPGSIIFVSPGVHTETITINKPIVLVGAGPNETIVQTQGNEPAFRVTSSDVTIMNMKISGGDGYGIELVDSSPSSLKNIQINRVLFENNAQGGVLAQGLISGSPMDYAIENNTFIGGASGITINMIGTQAETSIVRNNIFFGQTAAPVRVLSTNDSRVEYSYNLFDDCGLGACTTNWRQGNMSAVSSAHDNLFDLNPLFASPEHGAYQLSTGSPAIDAGDPSLFHDFFFDGDDDGFARIDLGPFEYATIENVAPVVNAGSDQTAELGSSVTVNAAYTDADNSEDHSARIDWGDGVIEDVPVTMTGPGAGEVTGQHTYANTGNYTVEVCMADLYGGVGCDTATIVVSQLACTPSNAYATSQGTAHFASFQPTSSTTDFSRLPLSFVPNFGQEDGAVKFQAQGLGGKLFFTPGEVVFSLPNPVKVKENEIDQMRYDLHPANVVRIHYQGANENPAVVGMGELPGVVNYLQGNDPSAWHTNLPTYAGIAYRELYPGIELRYEGTDGNLKSTFYVSPGANPTSIVWKYKGADPVRVDASGNLVITLPSLIEGELGRTLVEQAPIAWQELNGNRLMVAVQFAVDRGDKKISFVFPEGYDPSLPLVIDPTLAYSTYLGGAHTDYANAMTLDAECNAYVTGITASSGFPVVNPYQTNVPGMDAFVSKLNPAGDTLLYSTYLQGSESDRAWGISLDTQGRITIVGETASANFPMMNAYDGTYASGTCSDDPCDDVFVTQLSADGGTLLYSTYLGGSPDDQPTAVMMGADDTIYLTGWTKSSDFPTLNGYDTSFGGGTCSGAPCEDVFVARIDPALSGTASLKYSTYLGGSHYDKSQALAVDSNGHVYITGPTRSSNYPTRTPYQAVKASGADIFITKLNPGAMGDASLLYSTYFGGAGSEHAFGLALHGADQVYFTGYTESANFPTVNAFDTIEGSCGSTLCSDAFVTHLNIATNTLVFSSYLGGSSEDSGSGITVDDLGNVYVTGYTKSVNFPLVNAIQGQKGADGCSSPPCADAFVTKLNAAGNAILYSTYLGGNGDDYGNAIVVDGLGGVYIVGSTFSTDFPTTFFPYGGSGYSDAFVVKLEE